MSTIFIAFLFLIAFLSLYFCFRLIFVGVSLYFCHEKNSYKNIFRAKIQFDTRCDLGRSTHFIQCYHLQRTKFTNA